MEYQRTTIHALKEYLSALIASHFANGDIQFASQYNLGNQLYEGQVWLQTTFGYEKNGVNGLTAKDINMKMDDQEPGFPPYKQVQSNARYYIDETVDIPLAYLDYAFLYESKKKSLLGGKKYRNLYFSTPITATLNDELIPKYLKDYLKGNEAPIAKLVVMLYIDEEVLTDLRQRYNNHTLKECLRLHVKGPAALYGGESGSWQKWLEYSLCILPEDQQAIGIVKAEAWPFLKKSFFEMFNDVDK